MSQVENAMPPLSVQAPASSVLPISWPATWLAVLSLAALINAAMIFLMHGSQGYFMIALATAVCVLAALNDGFTCRIPNQLTYTGILMGLAINTAATLLGKANAGIVVTWLGAPGMLESFLGFGVCLLLGLVAGVMAGIHGGDLKLFAAVGAMLGLTITASISILALILGLSYALINLVCMGRLTLAWRIGSQRALELAYLRKFHTVIPETIPASHIPMAVPMGVSMIAVLFLQARYAGGRLW